MSDHESKQSNEISGIEKYEGSFEQDDLGVTQIPTETILSIKNLTLLGFYTYLASRPKDWKLNAKHLASHFDCNKEKIYKIIDALMEMGFLKRTQIRNKGMFVRYHYRLYLRQIVHAEPCLEKPYTVKPDTEKPDAYKTKSLKSKDSNVVVDQPTQQSSKEKIESEAISNKENTELFNKKFSTRDVTIEQIFKACQEFNAPRSRWVGSQLFNKWLTNENPENYAKINSNQSNKKNIHPKAFAYNEHVGRIKSDITLGLLSPDTHVPSFNEWNQENV